ncbi:MAG: DNA polymerase III subunit gamma/tau [Firmicutes bacterium]|nr:DNA polymerase III subunit gamma/tau [Bacillota bacterium]
MNTSINSLYRKYRPATFDDVVAQTHIVKTLQNQIKSGKVNHAYLFVGTRGTGKTTIAKIFAREINGGGGEHDIFEIDAASNNSVDNVRELIEKIKFPPVTGKYKVYIIDEVHMFSGSAFNALLKTLEEPPSHVIFILCTTEAHKLPQTILSRVLRFDFMPFPTADITARLTHIFTKESIKAEPTAIEMIAKMGRGSMRDSLSIAEAVSAYTKNIKTRDVEDVLGTVGDETLGTLASAILKKDIDGITKTLETIFSRSVNAVALVSQFLAVLRDMFIKTKDVNVMRVYKSFAEIELLVKTAADPSGMFSGTAYLSAV